MTLYEKTLIYAWLGYWRDKMPARAVVELQDLLDPPDTADQPFTYTGRQFTLDGVEVTVTDYSGQSGDEASKEPSDQPPTPARP